MLNGKAIIIHLMVGLVKKILLYKMNCLPELDAHSKNKIKFQLDLSNYTPKSGLKSATGVNVSTLAKKIDLASLKSDFDRLQTLINYSY